MAFLRPSRWITPAFGAGPVHPFPADIILRFCLFGFFSLYMVLGASRDTGLSVAVAAVVLAHALAATIAFRRARHNDRRLLTTWAILIPTDVLLIMLAAYADGTEDSPIVLLAFASLFTSSAMFEMRYVLAVAALAASGILAVDGLKDTGGYVEFHPIFQGCLVLFVAGFAGNRSRSEAKLRRQITESEAREREQSAALRSALEAARVSEARFQAISNYAPAILVLFDERGEPVFASRSLGDIVGVGAEALGDEKVKSDRLSVADRRSIRDGINGALGGQSGNVEFSVLDGSGQWRRMASIFFPMAGGAGAIAIDVTAERALATQVARAQQMETLGTLAGGIAHDFNNLLTAILGNLYMVEQHLGQQSPLRPLVADAQVAGQRGADLVRQLLNYSRPNFETLEPVSLSRLIEETARLGQRGITPSIALLVQPGDHSAFVSGNFGALEQVLLNLIVNARDAMPAGGTLTVSSNRVEVTEEYARARLDARPGSFHTITVSDTGTGMPPDTVARIFDPFFTTKEVGKGTGLGLATSLSILKAHGGWMEVESRQGEGSTFRILLPALPVPAADAAPEAFAPAT